LLESIIKLSIGIPKKGCRAGFALAGAPPVQWANPANSRLTSWTLNLLVRREGCRIERNDANTWVPKTVPIAPCNI
jgi:hypothetical protein